MKKILIRAFIVSLFLVSFRICIPYALQDNKGFAKYSKDCSIKRLPNKATNINYRLPGVFGPNTFYNFSINEKGFREWVRKSKKRFPELSKIEFCPGRKYIREYTHKTNTDKYIFISNYLLAQWNFTDIGVSFIYDKSAQKAYYHYHSR